MTQLTPNFSLAELIRSDTARAIGDPNLPTPAHRRNLLVLAEGLERVRVIAGGRALHVHSGYRNPAVNAAVGGVPTSAHALGLAADITVAGYTATALALKLAEAVRAGSLRVDQLILETSRGVVHVSFDPRLRGQILTQAGKAGTKVVQGIVA